MTSPVMKDTPDVLLVMFLMYAFELLSFIV